MACGADAEIQYDTGLLISLRWGTGGSRSGSVQGNSYTNIPVRSFVYDKNIRLPNGFAIHYISGYELACLVPDDLVEYIRNLVAVKIMSSYGDGIVSGLANFSIGVGVLHESVGTTMSATSAFFGARIKEFQDWIKDWKERNMNRYKRPSLTYL